MPRVRRPVMKMVIVASSRAEGKLSLRVNAEDEYANSIRDGLVTAGFAAGDSVVLLHADDPRLNDGTPAK